MDQSRLDYLAGAVWTHHSPASFPNRVLEPASGLTNFDLIELIEHAGKWLEHVAHTVLVDVGLESDNAPADPAPAAPEPDASTGSAVEPSGPADTAPAAPAPDAPANDTGAVADAPATAAPAATPDTPAALPASAETGS